MGLASDASYGVPYSVEVLGGKIGRVFGITST